MSTIGIAYDSIGDLANHALPKFMKRGQFEKTLRLQRYRAREFFQEGNVKVDSGNKLEWRVVYGHNQSARYIRPFQTTPTDYKNVFTKASAPWRHAEAKASYNQIIADDMGGPEKIVDYLDGEYVVAVESLVELLEGSLIEVPNNADDDQAAMGFPYWFPFIEAGSAEDLLGDFRGKTVRYGDGSTSTTIGQYDRSTEALSQTWAAHHRGTVDLQFLRTLRRMMTYNGFVEPEDMRQFMMEGEDKWRFYTDMDRKLEYEDLANSGSHEGNGDLNPFKGVLTYRGLRWLDLPVLNGVTYTPAYLINLRFYKAWRHTKYWWLMGKAKVRDDRFTYDVPWDCRFNYALSRGRGGGGVMHTRIAS